MPEIVLTPSGNEIGQWSVRIPVKGLLNETEFAKYVATAGLLVAGMQDVAFISHSPALAAPEVTQTTNEIASAENLKIATFPYLVEVVPFGNVKKPGR